MGKNNRNSPSARLSSQRYFAAKAQQPPVNIRPQDAHPSFLAARQRLNIRDPEDWPQIHPQQQAVNDWFPSP